MTRRNQEWSPGAAGPVLGIFGIGGDERPDGYDWRDDALCAQTDPEAFFPEKGGSTREAKKVCRACDVRADCLEYALEHEERFGIWGGLSERERLRLRREAGSEPTRRRRRPVMLERYEALASRGVDPVVIADELGVTRRSVNRLAERARERERAA